MSWDKTTLTDRPGYENIVGQKINYSLTYGGNIKTIIKPFTTATNASGVPRYSIPFYGSGYGSSIANSSGLNPYGDHTLYEGIVHGNVMPTDIQGSINATGVRTFGLRNPMQIVGWGYDQFGYPIPNHNRNWSISGAFGTDVPSGNFLASGFTFTAAGRNVPYPFWQAGPLDLRFDIHRKVWTTSQGVFPARVSEVTNTSGIASTGYDFAENFRYTAQIYDGVANTMLVTGVAHLGAKPEIGSYKVNPLASGDFCFIVHTVDSATNKPKYGIYLIESPGSDECNNIAGGAGETANGALYGGSGNGDWVTSSGLLVGSGFAQGLTHYPMSVPYGGLGFTSIASGAILIGMSGNQVGRYTMIAGSGIELLINNYANPTGTVTVRFASGVDFNTAGVNFTITALSGLTTPLSISGGGTGTNYKSWVDLTTNQSILGLKTFDGRIRISSGTLNNLALGFDTNINTGFYLSDSGILNNVSSGIVIHRTTPTGNVFTHAVTIKNSSYSSDIPALRVYDHSSNASGGPLMQWLTAGGVELGKVSTTGHIYSRFFHTSGTPTTGVAIAINLPASFIGIPIQIQVTGQPIFEVNAAGDRITFDRNKIGGTAGYVKITTVSGMSAGYIDISATASGNGGYINTASQGGGAGGYINTQAGTAANTPGGNLILNGGASVGLGGGSINMSNGGGSLDTSSNTSYLQLGPSGNRITMTKQSHSNNHTLTLPSGDGLLATTGFVLTMVSGFTGTINFAATGAGKMHTLTFNRGIITQVAENQPIP